MEAISTESQIMEYPVNSPEWHIQQLLVLLGQDVTREGLVKTPHRYVKALTEFLNPSSFEFTTFDADGTDEMIIVKDIPFYSMCEHHLFPFFGVAHVAYIPDGKIVGLSKLPRTVDLYAGRLQNQERLTMQIAERIEKELNPKGVAVTMKAQHLCMCMRGVKKQDSYTTTTCLKGLFKEGTVRSEYLSMTK